MEGKNREEEEEGELAGKLGELQLRGVSQVCLL